VLHAVPFQCSSNGLPESWTSQQSVVLEHDTEKGRPVVDRVPRVHIVPSHLRT
jgi:hypothetical protein